MFDPWPSVRILVVSYDSQDALRTTLEEHEIEVVLSTLSPIFKTFDAQVRLIRACADSDSVKRFAPSEWLLDFEKEKYVPDVNTSPLQEKRDIVDS
jgi:hypothetical protein